jgi:hypothetical protein
MTGCGATSAGSALSVPWTIFFPSYAQGFMYQKIYFGCFPGLQAPALDFSAHATNLKVDRDR